MAESTTLCCIGCSICAAITCLIILLISIGTVEPIEYAVKYNAITKNIDRENVYSGGWYIIGPVDSFFTFPATFVNMDFTDFPDARTMPINVKDRDGQEIRLSLSIQYQLEKENLVKLYLEFQKSYE